MGRLKYKGYIGTVDYNEEDQCLTGKVLGLRRDGIIYEGMSVEELIEDFHNAVDHYLSSCAERGVAPEKPYSGRLILRLSPILHQDAAEMAAANGISLNEFITRAILTATAHSI